MVNFAQRHVALSKKSLRLLVGLLLVGLVEMAVAAPSNVTDAEMKLLPRYCPDTQTFKNGSPQYSPSQRAQYWVSVMGKAFWAMHHYCWAQISMNRSRKAGITAQERRGMWESARGDYGYVIENSQPDFILLPEIFTRIGEVELLLGRANNADEAFARARQLKPDYWPAYSQWAEFLMQRGRRPEALKIVASGLQHSPDAKVLREQFRVLGGKSSDIPKAIDEPPTDTDPTSRAAPAATSKPLGPDIQSEEK